MMSETVFLFIIYLPGAIKKSILEAIALYENMVNKSLPLLTLFSSLPLQGLSDQT